MLSKANQFAKISHHKPQCYPYMCHTEVSTLWDEMAKKQLNIVIDPQQFGLVIAISLTDKSLQDILSMHTDLFKPGLGCCITAKASLVLQDNAQPKYCNPRKLPFAIKPVVGAEFDHLEQDGVLERVSHSDWAIPIVAIRKPTGKVRVCEDFKVTINPVHKSDIHPFPLPEELFHKLNQGTVANFLR